MIFLAAFPRFSIDDHQWLDILWMRFLRYHSNLFYENKLHSLELLSHFSFL